MSSAVRYHINPDTQKPNECKAQIKCQYSVDGQEPIHFSTMKEARVYVERELKSKSDASGNPFGGVTKASVLDRGVVSVSDGILENLDDWRLGHPDHVVLVSRGRRKNIVSYSVSRDGKFDREDGPAVLRDSGTKEWYRGGVLHRVGGPAIEYASGSEGWYRGGVLHRDDGPAVVDDSGVNIWYKNGKRHRIGGPAVVNSDGSVQYWENGVMLS